MLTDAYLDEERYDILIYNIQDPNAPDYELESYDDGGPDAMGRDAKPCRLWWNNISREWRY